MAVMMRGHSGSNEHADVAALRINRVDGAGERSDRVTVMQGLLTEAVRGRVPLEEMGARMWWMLELLCPFLLWRLEGRELRLARGLPGRGWVTPELGEALAEDERWRLGELIGGGVDNLWSLGRRVTLLAYIFVREPGPVMQALPSMESIGELWELGAKNKRSAVCAALMKIQRELVDKSEMRMKDHETNQLWFQKRRSTRASYAEVAKGNDHRAAAKAQRDEDEDGAHVAAVAEIMEGVPVKAEWRGLRPAVVRAKLAALHEEAERRRLDGIRI